MNLIPLASLTTEARLSWESLARRAAEPNPFFEPAFLLPAWQAHGAEDEVSLLVYSQEGDWLGCSPVTVRRMRGGPRLLSTWTHAYSYLGTPLVDRDHVDGFGTAFAGLLEAREHSRFAVLRLIGEGAVLDAIRGGIEDSDSLRSIYEDSYERAALRRHGQPDYLEWMKPHRRRELKRLRRRLEDGVGGLEVQDRSNDSGAVDDFLRLERSGWKGQAGTAMAARAQDGEMFRRLCSAFAGENRLQLLALQAGERALAMKCNLIAGDAVFCFKIAYDEQYARFSPGVLLEVDNIELFHDRRREALMDSCADPNHPMINRLWQERRTIVTTMIGPRGPLGWAAVNSRAALQAARAGRMRRHERRTETEPG